MVSDYGIGWTQIIFVHLAQENASLPGRSWDVQRGSLFWFQWPTAIMPRITLYCCALLKKSRATFHSCICMLARKRTAVLNRVWQFSLASTMKFALWDRNLIPGFTSGRQMLL